jgi:hypothetical protein
MSEAQSAYSITDLAGYAFGQPALQSSGNGSHRMTQPDEDAIRALEQSFNAAWDAHDPDGIAATLADDAQFITVNGAWTTSRA